MMGELTLEKIWWITYKINFKTYNLCVKKLSIKKIANTSLEKGKKKRKRKREQLAPKFIIKNHKTLLMENFVCT